MVTDLGECATEQREGGATSYHEGQCPATAAEAAALAQGELAESKPLLGASSPSVVIADGRTDQVSGLALTLVGVFAAALLAGSAALHLRGRQEARNAPLLEGVPE